MTMQNKDFTFEIILPENLLEYSGSKIGGSVFVNDHFSVDYEEEVNDADKWDYTVAFSSGVLTAALNVLWVKDFSIENAQSWGRKETSEFVIKVAKAQGYNGDELAGAIKKLESLFPIPADKLTSDFGGGLQHHLRDFEHHPTLAGLVFSILSQFTGMGYGTDTAGEFIIKQIPENAMVGGSVAEKIFAGTVIWAFHLISDIAGSSSSPGKGTGIPGPLLAALKELSTLPIFRNQTISYKDQDISLSVWISKLFNGTYFVNPKTRERVRFDFRTELGVFAQFAQQATPVIINEVIVRAFYFIKRFVFEIKDKQISSLSELNKIESDKVLPINNRTIARMITVSSGTFVSLVTANAAVCAAIKNKGLKDNFAMDFLVKLNYPGMVRFAFACKTEFNYMTEDFQEAYYDFVRKKYSINSESDFSFISLSERQRNILLSLQYALVENDIKATKNEKAKQTKLVWLDQWAKLNLQIKMVIEKEHLFVPEKVAYHQLRSELAIDKPKEWFYNLILELVDFKPYIKLGLKDDKQFKGLKVTSDYIKDVFCKKLDFDYEEVVELKGCYKKAADIMDSKFQKTLLTVALGGAAVLVTGGAAAAFAPQLAVAIAGSSFAGLHGAALTSASLAALGGGSIAAGGFGMVGGTAVIAGSGAVLGGLGSANAALMINMFSSKDYFAYQCSKLLAICSYVSKHCTVDIAPVQNELAKYIETANSEIKNYNKKKATKQEKAIFKQYQTNLKCLDQCNKELSKLINP